jgi:hypothetical protein
MAGPNTPNDPVSVYFVDPDDGKMDQASTGHIFNTIRQMGYEPVGISADGLTFTIKDQQGTFDMDAGDILRNVGFDVKYVKPNAPLENKINLQHRLAISRLPDDDAKKAYLEAKLKRDGIENPKVHGEGRDFYYYDANDNQWHALTNSKNWDLSDAVEAGAEVLTGGAAGLGGLAGGILGGGSTMGAGAIPGAMAGAGLASGAAETALRGGLNYFDPEYADVTTLGGQAKDIALTAGLNTALAGVPAVAGKVLPKFVGASEEGIKQLFRTGPVSAVAKGAGKTLQAGGSLAKTAGNLAQTPLGKEAVKAVTPGLSQMQIASTALQAPEFLTVAASKGANKVAQSVGTEEAKQAAKQVLTKEAPIGVFEKFNRWARGINTPRDVQASAVMQNVAENIAKKAGAEEANVQFVKQLGAKTGKTMEDLATMGRNIEKASDVAVKTGANVAKGLGTASQVTGKGLQAVGNVVQPFETQIMGQAAGREYLLPEARKKLMEKERRDLQHKLDVKSGKIKPI